jgi:signal transduction histidine kinase
VVWIDPNRIVRNSVPPGVTVDSIFTNGKTYHPLSALAFPARTTSLRIAFTAASMTIPERVRFRYWLEGVDKDWQDSGTRRETSYTNLGPGSYRFRVIACNSDGVWNEAGAVAGFTIAPTFYQTSWFHGLSVLMAGFLLAGAYRLRVRQLAGAMHARFNERLAERTRIARELHDTLLQSFQGSLFEFQPARNLLSRRPEQAALSLDAAIRTAEGAIAEGRDAIQDLRSGPTVGNDLSRLLTAAGQECSSAQGLNGNSAAFRLTVEGEPQTLSPALHDEIYRIGREILRNAFRHAHAKRIEVEIRYDERELRIRFRDDGIGIDPTVLNEGARPGHWGLPGVRERATLIGAQLQIWSELGAGMEVQLTVPASAAYAKPPKTRVFGFFRKRSTSHGA